MTKDSALKSSKIKYKNKKIIHDDMCRKIDQLEENNSITVSNMLRYFHPLIGRFNN